jgi:hypothetical protein
MDEYSGVFDPDCPAHPLPIADPDEDTATIVEFQRITVCMLESSE